MLEETTYHILVPGEPETEEPAPPHGDSADALSLEDEVGTGGQVAPASPGGPEATAASQAKAGCQWKTKEWLRLKDGALGSSQFELPAPSEATSIFQGMIARGDYTRDPWERIPFPTCTEAYGTTGELFAKIKLAFKEQTQLSDRDCALLTFWVFSSHGSTQSLSSCTRPRD